MDTVISFTPSELVGFAGTIAGLVSAIGLLVSYAIKVTKRVKAPMEELKREITYLKKRDEEKDKKIEELERRLGDGDDHFKELEKANKMILKSLQALLRHSLGTDNPGALTKTMEELDDYFLDK